MYSVMDGLNGKTNPYHKKVKTKPLNNNKPRRYLKRCCVGLLHLCQSIRTTLLVLVTTLSMPGFYMTHYMLLNPGLATFTSSLHSGICTVAASTVLGGTTNCTWSSCRQGCTETELYVCWQVLVLPYNMTNNNNNNMASRGATGSSSATLLQHAMNASNTTEKLTSNNEGEAIPEPAAESRNVSSLDGIQLIPPEKDNDSGVEAAEDSATNIAAAFEWDIERYGNEPIRLFVNVEGCGYLPCEEWWLKYGKLGAVYPCFLSADRHIAIPEVDYDKAATQIVLGILPLLLTFLSFPIIYFVYCRKGGKNRILPIPPIKDLKKAKFEEARLALLMQKAVERNEKNKINPMLMKAVLAKSKAGQKGKVNKQQGTYGKEGDTRQENGDGG